MSSAEFISASEVTLVRGEPIPQSESYERSVAECWQQALERNPTLFNGPLVSPLQVSVSDGVCTLWWYHSDFAHYSFTRQNRELPATASVGTVFVSLAVPTSDGGLAVGRMSDHTSAPGVVQLPGGGLSIGPEQRVISDRDLRATAVEEVSEELGIILNPANLQIHGVIKRHSPPDVGVVFTTEARPWGDVLEAFAALQAREREAGAASEFAELLAVSPSGDLPYARSGRGHMIDYLPAVIDAFFKTRGGVT